MAETSVKIQGTRTEPAVAGSEYGTFDIFELALYVWTRKAWVAAVAILVIALSVVYAIITKPVFEAESKLYCKTSAAQAGGLANFAELAGISLGQSNKTDPSIFFEEVVKEDGFLEKILAKKWAYQGDSLRLEEIWKVKPDTTKPRWREIQRELNIRQVRDGILLKKDTKKNLVTLTTHFGDARLTHDINAFIIQELNRYVVQVFRSQAKEVRKFVETRIREVEVELNRSESALADFQAGNQGVMAPHIRMQEKRLQRTLMVNQEMFFQLKKQLDLAIIEEYKDQPLVEVIVPPKVPLFKHKPKRRNIVLIGAVAGAVAGVLFVIGAGLMGFLFREIGALRRETAGAR